MSDQAPDATVEALRQTFIDEWYGERLRRALAPGTRRDAVTTPLTGDHDATIETRPGDREWDRDLTVEDTGLRAWLDDPLRDYLDDRDRAYLATLAARATHQEAAPEPLRRQDFYDALSRDADVNAGWNAALDELIERHGPCFYVYGPGRDVCPHGIRAATPEAAPEEGPGVRSAALHKAWVDHGGDYYYGPLFWDELVNRFSEVAALVDSPAATSAPTIEEPGT